MDCVLFLFTPDFFKIISSNFLATFNTVMNLMNFYEDFSEVNIRR